MAKKSKTRKSVVRRIREEKRLANLKEAKTKLENDEPKIAFSARKHIVEKRAKKLGMDPIAYQIIFNPERMDE